MMIEFYGADRLKDIAFLADRIMEGGEMTGQGVEIYPKSLSGEQKNTMSSPRQNAIKPTH